MLTSHLSSASSTIQLLAASSTRYRCLTLRAVKVPTNKEVYFVWFMSMRGKQVSARAIEIQKEN